MLSLLRVASQRGDGGGAQGFVQNMEEWMHASDVIITKAGPGTIAESFICGLPVLLNGYIPGQEEGNIDYVLEHKVHPPPPHPPVPPPLPPPEHCSGTARKSPSSSGGATRRDRGICN